MALLKRGVEQQCKGKHCIIGHRADLLLVLQQHCIFKENDHIRKECKWVTKTQWHMQGHCESCLCYHIHLLPCFDVLWWQKINQFLEAGMFTFTESCSSHSTLPWQKVEILQILFHAICFLPFSLWTMPHRAGACSGQPAASHLWQGTGVVSRFLPAAWHLRTQQVTVTDRHQQRDYFTAPCWQQPCGCKGSFCASSPTDTQAARKSAAHFGNLPDSYNFISRGTYSCIKPWYSPQCPGSSPFLTTRFVPLLKVRRGSFCAALVPCHTSTSPRVVAVLRRLMSMCLRPFGLSVSPQDTV